MSPEGRIDELERERDALLEALEKAEAQRDDYSERYHALAGGFDLVNAYEEIKAERAALLLQVRRLEIENAHLREQGEADSAAMHQLCDENLRLKDRGRLPM